LPEKAPAAVAGVPAVRVDDDLAAGQAGVAHRAAHLEPPGRVDQQPVALGVQAEALELGVDDVLADVRREQRLEGDVGRVLAGHHDGVEPDRAQAVVLDGDLGLAVGPQVRDGAVAADRGQPPRQAVRQRDRQRHQLGGLGAREAEHHALVTGALGVQRAVGLAGAELDRRVHALGDVGRLGADGDVHAAGGAVEALLGRVVADAQDGLADDRVDVGVRLGRDLAGDVDLTGRDQRLDGDPAVRVLVEQGVEDAVADLVGDLVRVAFGDRLGGEKAACHVTPRDCVLIRRAAACWQSLARTARRPETPPARS
jgi:hypothetical protein